MRRNVRRNTQQACLGSALNQPPPGSRRRFKRNRVRAAACENQPYFADPGGEAIFGSLAHTGPVGLDLLLQGAGS
jgi:hypothetical protein